MSVNDIVFDGEPFVLSDFTLTPMEQNEVYAYLRFHRWIDQNQHITLLGEEFLLMDDHAAFADTVSLFLSSYEGETYFEKSCLNQESDLHLSCPFCDDRVCERKQRFFSFPKVYNKNPYRSFSSSIL